MNDYYKVTVGATEWGCTDSLEKANKLYDDAKEHNTDCFIGLFKITQETIKHEWNPCEED